MLSIFQLALAGIHSLSSHSACSTHRLELLSVFVLGSSKTDLSPRIEPSSRLSCSYLPYSFNYLPSIQFWCSLFLFSCVVELLKILFSLLLDIDAAFDRRTEWHVGRLQACGLHRICSNSSEWFYGGLLLLREPYFLLMCSLFSRPTKWNR